MKYISFSPTGPSEEEGLCAHTDQTVAYVTEYCNAVRVVDSHSSAGQPIMSVSLMCE